MKRAPQKTPQGSEGFALVELLIVIVIIGILAAVLVPSLLGARETARERAAAAHAKNVYTAAVAYVSENENASPVLGACDTGYVAGEYSVDDPGTSTVTSCEVTDADGDDLPEVEVVTPTNLTIRHPN